MRLKIFQKGDTLIEVMLAISIFSFVAILTINLMNDGLNNAQRTLEETMARNEIDTQAEALRFIHNNYVAERQLTADHSQFRKIWETIVSQTMTPDNPTSEGFDVNNVDSCDDLYTKNGHFGKYKTFVLNPRLLLPDASDSEDVKQSTSNYEYMGKSYSDLIKNEIIVHNNPGPSPTFADFSSPSLYPRLLFTKLDNDKTNDETLDESTNKVDEKPYNKLARAEGVWVNGVGDNDTVSRSNFYDFYIRTCWQAAGQRHPTTITTVVRLYNPGVFE